jgi:hypothetical protein
VDFEKYILGNWSNKAQAQSDPQNFATVNIVWQKIEGGYESMNYKRCRGAYDPYRRKYHKLEQVSDTEVIMHNYHMDWTPHDICDMIFTFDGTIWKGSLLGDECRGYRGHRVISHVQLFGHKLYSMDQGYDDEGNFVWGSDKFYRFTRMKGE